MKFIIILTLTIVCWSCSNTIQTNKETSLKSIKEVSFILDSNQKIIDSTILSIENYNTNGLKFQEIFYNKKQEIINIWTYSYGPNNQSKYAYRFDKRSNNFTIDTFIYSNNHLAQRKTIGPVYTNKKSLITNYLKDGRIENIIDITHHQHSKTQYNIQYKYDAGKNIIGKYRYELLTTNTSDKDEYSTLPTDKWEHQICQLENNTKEIIAQCFLEDTLMQTIKYHTTEDLQGNITSKTIFKDDLITPSQIIKYQRNYFNE